MQAGASFPEPPFDPKRIGAPNSRSTRESSQHQSRPSLKAFGRWPSAETDCCDYLHPRGFCSKEKSCGHRHNYSLYKLLKANVIAVSRLPACRAWLASGACPNGIACTLFHPPSEAIPARYAATSASATAYEGSSSMNVHGKPLDEGICPFEIVPVDGSRAVEIHVFWDTENCGLPRPALVLGPDGKIVNPPSTSVSGVGSSSSVAGGGGGAPSSSAAASPPPPPTAAEVLTSLEHVFRAVTATDRVTVKVKAFHSPSNLKESEKVSLRTYYGCDVIDCGSKTGAVDTQMSAQLMKFAVEHVKSAATAAAARDSMHKPTSGHHQQQSQHFGGLEHDEPSDGGGGSRNSSSGSGGGASWAVIISGDRDFATEASTLRDAANVPTIIIHNDVANRDYTSRGSASFSWRLVLDHAAFRKGLARNVHPTELLWVGEVAKEVPRSEAPFAFQRPPSAAASKGRALMQKQHFAASHDDTAAIGKGGVTDADHGYADDDDDEGENPSPSPPASGGDGSGSAAHRTADRSRRVASGHRSAADGREGAGAADNVDVSGVPPEFLREHYIAEQRMREAAVLRHHHRHHLYDGHMSSSSGHRQLQQLQAFGGEHTPPHVDGLGAESSSSTAATAASPSFEIIPLKQPKKSSVVCQYFLRRACKRGFACHYLHPCSHWNIGTQSGCKNGEECRFDHIQRDGRANERQLQYQQQQQLMQQQQQAQSSSLPAAAASAAAAAAAGGSAAPAAKPDRAAPAALTGAGPVGAAGAARSGSASGSPARVPPRRAAAPTSSSASFAASPPAAAAPDASRSVSGPPAHPSDTASAGAGAGHGATSGQRRDNTEFGVNVDSPAFQAILQQGVAEGVAKAMQLMRLQQQQQQLSKGPEISGAAGGGDAGAAYGSGKDHRTTPGRHDNDDHYAGHDYYDDPSPTGSYQQHHHRQHQQQGHRGQGQQQRRPHQHLIASQQPAGSTSVASHALAQPPAAQPQPSRRNRAPAAAVGGATASGHGAGTAAGGGGQGGKPRANNVVITNVAPCRFWKGPGQPDSCRKGDACEFAHRS